MENEFEKYLQQNRDRFEKGSPSPRVWEKLQRDLIEHQTRRHRVIRMRRIGWSIAACIVLCTSVVLFIFRPIKNETITRNDRHHDSVLDQQKILAEKIEQDSALRMAGVTDDKTRQSLFRYTKLIETRQKQMAVLQQVNPQLYASSQKVLLDLNQVYNRLQKQLPGSPDQQKVLQALIQNLKMQEQILNNQLQLLEELQNNTTDEKKVKKI
jgi:hypothetical protein